MLNALLWNLLLTTGLAVVLFGACRMRWLHRRPALRCWLWVLLFVKLVTPPLIDLPMLPAVASAPVPLVTATDMPQSKAVKKAEAPSVARPDLTLENFDPIQPEIVADLSTDGPSEATVLPEVAEVAAEVSNDIKPVFEVPYLAILCTISLIGTGVLWGVYGWGTWQVHRRLRRVGQEDPGLTAVCKAVGEVLKIRRAVRGLVVRSRTTPLLWTWGRPTVAVPSRLLEEIEPGQLRQIVAHELAHLSRRDHWVSLFVFLVKSLWWWNPIVWWADRELCVAQELCCDAIAIECCQASRRGYATTLLQALEFIQTEPSVTYALALRMGSKQSILRRFEMIGETRLTYRLSRWTFLALLVLAVPLVCMPVRGQEKMAVETPRDEKPTATAVNETEKEGDTKTEKVSKEKPAAAAVNEAEKEGYMEEGYMEMEEDKPLDPKTRALGEATLKRLKNYSDEATLTLADGETGRIKVKKNRTPVAAILITAHFLKKAAYFDFQGVDEDGDAIDGAILKSLKVLDGKTTQCGLATAFFDDGENFFCYFKLSSKRIEGKKVEVNMKVLFTRVLTVEESFAANKVWWEKGGMQPEVEPLTDEEREELNQLKVPETRDLPYGNCSIGGKIVSDETGKPIANALIHLVYAKTDTISQMNTASDGMFSFKNIPQGTYSLQTMVMPERSDYQDVVYNPEGKSEPSPKFLLKEGERRSNIVLKTKKGYCISGMVRDENGNPPAGSGFLPRMIMAWHKEKNDNGMKMYYAGISPDDGSYRLKGLDGKPVYVQTFDFNIMNKWDTNPSVYYPGTFFRDEAKQITFDEVGENRLVENVYFTLKKEGGLSIEGTVRDEDGKPVPETLVLANQTDTSIGEIAAHTDKEGKYELRCLGNGEFYLHADALHRGFVAARKTITLKKENQKTKQDFTLSRGVTISGKFVDEAGRKWKVSKSSGRADIIEEKQDPTKKTAWMSGLRNRYNKTSRNPFKSTYSIEGTGSYPPGKMGFPTKSTFLFQAMPPGRTKIDFSVKQDGQTVKKILYKGKDVTTSGFETKPGEDVKEVTIVIGKKKP